MLNVIAIAAAVRPIVRFFRVFFFSDLVFVFVFILISILLFHIVWPEQIVRTGVLFFFTYTYEKENEKTGGLKKFFLYFIIFPVEDTISCQADHNRKQGSCGSRKAHWQQRIGKTPGGDISYGDPEQHNGKRIVQE